MAGRPQKRARQQVAVPPPPVATDWEAEAAKLMMEAAAPLPIPALPVLAAPVARADARREDQNLDRRSLAEWWREQMATLEQEHQDRMELLATAGEHPSPMFAAQVRRFAAIGMPPDVLGFMLGITEGMLMEFYEEECRIGEGLFLGPVFANLFRIATSANDRVAVKAATEIVNRRGGEPWRPPAQKLEINDGGQKKQNYLEVSQLSYDERQQLRAIIEKRLAARALPAPEAGLANDE